MDMNSEESRLRTFQCWPSNAVVDPRKIAKAGFFYVGRGVEVQCFKCGGKISEWNYGDLAMGRHRTLDPRCPFVVDPEGSGNVPLGGPPPVLRLPPLLNARREEGAPLDFTSEEARLESFSTWPLPSPINPQILAQSGFYYTRMGDKVRCAFCSGEVDSWTGKEIPDEVHRNRFPQCTYMLDRLFVGEDLGVSKVDGNSSSMKELGISTHKVPANPKYSTYESRFKTFSSWPAALCQKPEEMAKAGFYFTGKDDQVRCFHCDGGLRLWEKDDIPWREHARWFSECEYVVLVMGQDFIDETLKSGAKAFMQATNEMTDMMGQSNHMNGAVKVPAQKTVQRLHSVSEDELQHLMCSPEAMAALQVGIEHSRVKMALKKKVQMTGTPFPSADILISAALDMQNEESASQEDETWGTPPNSPHFGWPRVSRRRNYNPSPIESSTDDDDDHETHSAVATSDNNENKSNLPEEVPEESPPEQVSMSLEEENRRLKEARLCKICMDSEVGVVFLPCGHLVTCANCAHSLIDCPLCRQVIKATVRTFLS